MCGLQRRRSWYSLIIAESSETPKIRRCPTNYAKAYKLQDKDRKPRLPCLNLFRILGHINGSTLEFSSNEIMASWMQGMLTAYSVVA